MSTLRLLGAYLRARPLMTLLTLLLVALGMATVVMVTLVTRQFDDRLRRDAAGIDLVVGAKGSPLQLVLSGVYHLDVPPGNIPYTSLASLREHRFVAAAIPLSLGDSFRGFRIVGTEPAFVDMHAARFERGAVFDRPMQAVLGARVARETGLAPGDTFAGTHGLSAGGAAHANDIYTVTGVLAPTGGVIDRLVLTATESVWQTHEHGHGAAPASGQDKARRAADQGNAAAPAPVKGKAAGQADHGHSHGYRHGTRKDHPRKQPENPPGHPPTGQTSSPVEDHHHDDEPDREITLILVRYASPLAAVSLPREINASERLQAGSPAFESARLVQLVGVGVDGLRAFGLLILVVSALSVFVALFQALSDRRREMALMRLLGASPGKLFGLLLLEGLALTGLGVLLGMALGHLIVELAGTRLIPRGEWPLTGWVFDSMEWVWAVGALALGAVASLWPAWRASRIGLADVLADD